jgi:hypothetical protein
MVQSLEREVTTDSAISYGFLFAQQPGFFSNHSDTVGDSEAV